MHLCAGLTAASWIIEPFGEIGANFYLQLSSPHSLLKLVIKKLLPKINVKSIKLELRRVSFDIKFTRQALRTLVDIPRLAEI